MQSTLLLQIYKYTPTSFKSQTTDVCRLYKKRRHNRSIETADGSPERQ